MIYLKRFTIPSENDEIDFLLPGNTNKFGDYRLNMECYSHNNVYPFKVFTNKGITNFDFSEITVFYGGNGAGKSTVLNLIAESLKIERSAPFNKTPFFEDYANMCKAETVLDNFSKSKIITSDDVFDYLLDMRSVNQGIEERREELFSEYYRVKEGSKQSPILLNSIDEYKDFKRNNEIRFKTKSEFVSKYLLKREFKGNSNGESAFAYFTNEIKENALYILDEPENSLSPGLQLELADFITSSARFYGCQFIISTHSPFILSIKGARVYDLDATPVTVKKWTELENVKMYYNLFKSHENEFHC